MVGACCSLLLCCIVLGLRDRVDFCACFFGETWPIEGGAYADRVRVNVRTSLVACLLCVQIIHADDLQRRTLCSVLDVSQLTIVHGFHSLSE